MNKTKKITRTPIGRDLSLMDLQSSIEKNNEKSWRLDSGKSIKYKEIFFSYDDLINNVEVDFILNGRLQEHLKPENLTDITSTIDRVQYKNIVLRKLPDQKWEVLEGSRRLAGALLKKVGLRADCIDDMTISRADAMALADEMRYSKEHNLYELGKRWLDLKNDALYPLDQKEIADKFKVSEAKVSRAIQSASVCSELMILFPDVNELTFSQFKQLLAAQKYHTKHDETVLFTLIDEAKEKQKQDWKNLTNEAVTNKLLDHFKLESTTSKKNTFDVRSLAVFSDKNSYARKKTADRKIHYEFGRIKTEALVEIEQAIQQILSKHYS